MLVYIKREEQSQCFVIVPIPPFELVSLWLGIAWVPYGSVLSMSDQLFRIPYKLNITKKRHRILIQWPYRLKADLAYCECFVIMCYTFELRRVGRALCEIRNRATFHFPLSTSTSTLQIHFPSTFHIHSIHFPSIHFPSKSILSHTHTSFTYQLFSLKLS